MLKEMCNFVAHPCLVWEEKKEHSCGLSINNLPNARCTDKSTHFLKNTKDGEQTLRTRDTVVLVSGYMVPKSGEEEVLRTHDLPSL